MVQASLGCSGFPFFGNFKAKVRWLSDRSTDSVNFDQSGKGEQEEMSLESASNFLQARLSKDPEECLGFFGAYSRVTEGVSCEFPEFEEFASNVE